MNTFSPKERSRSRCASIPTSTFFFQPGDSGCLDSTPVGLLGQGCLLTFKLCGANEAQRSLRPNERLVRRNYVQC